jgi:sigma-54 dependent transcriptional regulator, acetoin dehydrogenase operon transcriptional activator AcoR
MAHPPRSRDAGHTGLPARPFFNTPAQRTALARQRFFEDGERPTGLVPEPVIQSWLHCMALGRAPQQRASLDPVSRGRRSEVLARSHALLEAAGPELDHLDDMLAGTPVKALLADRHGMIVRATPVRPEDGRLLRSSCQVGRDMGEALLGTTAPGITARTGQACTVLGGEHFLDEVQVMHCTAAPIHNARGELVGVLDLSVESRPFGFDAASLVRMTAVAIENRLLLHQARQDVILRFQTHPSLIGTPLEGIAAVTSGGDIAWLNATGGKLVVPERGAAGTTSVEALFGMDLPSLLAHCGGTRPLRVPAPSGLRLWLTVRVQPGESPARPALARAEPAPAQPTLKDSSRQRIDAALAEHGGNIASTARALGVSRGLIYRHLARGGSQPA